MSSNTQMTQESVSVQTPSSVPTVGAGVPSSAAAAAANTHIDLAPQQAQQQAAAFQANFNSTSLYVGDLAPNVTEGLLFDLFNAIGPVASIRVCRDNVTRLSLGYAYVNFHNHADAERALDTVNYTSIKGRPCRIMWSQRDPSLRKNGNGNIFIKNLDPSIDHKSLSDTFSLFGDILSCKVVVDPKTGESRGYGFVHFDSPEAADEAIKKINGMLIAGKEVYVGRFLKRSDRVNNNAWTNVYVKNIPNHWDDKDLTQLFCECGEISSLVIMKDDEGKSKGFGFVDFVDHDGALNAIEKFNEYEVRTKEGEEQKVTVNNDHKKKQAEDTKALEEMIEKSEKIDQEAEEKPVVEDASAPAKLVQRLVVCKAQKKTERERELQSKFEQEKQDRLSKYQGVNLYVKNLHEDVDEDMLRAEFSQFGTITSCRIMRDQSEGAAVKTDESGKPVYPSKGFGFVCFSTSEEATKAVTEMNTKMIMNKPIYVALAQRKDARRAQLEAQHQPGVMGGRGAIPMQGPGMYPGAPMYFQGGVPQGAMRGGFTYLPQMMSRGMMPQGARGGPVAPGVGVMPRGAFPGMPGAGYPQMGGMNPNASRGGPNVGGRQRGGRQGGQQQQQQIGGAPNMAGQNIKYTASARNQPMTPYNQGMMGGVPMMGGPMMQQPPQQAQMAVVGPEPLTAAALANASDEQQKNMIGEKLYPLIHVVQPELAGKITGMLLEMDNPELLHLIESPESLHAKIQEALHVLDAHQSKASDA